MLKDFVSLEITNTMLKYPIPPLLILKATNSIHFIIRTWPLEPQLGRAWDPSWVQVLTSSERVCGMESRATDALGEGGNSVLACYACHNGTDDWRKWPARY